MSIFNNIFGNESKSKDPNIAWKYITNENQLDDLIENSNEKPALIFKHSTRCSISKMALRNFEREYDLSDKVTPYFLDLLSNRDISDEIARRFNVVHHSPQLLVIKNGKSIYDVSHDGIDVGRLKNQL